MTELQGDEKGPVAALVTSCSLTPHLDLSLHTA